MLNHVNASVISTWKSQEKVREFDEDWRVVMLCGYIPSTCRATFALPQKSACEVCRML